MPFNPGRTDVKENKQQSDGSQVFVIQEDMELFQVVPVFPSGAASGELEIWVKTHPDSEYENIVSPVTLLPEKINLAMPRSILFTAWIREIKIVPVGVSGRYSVIVKQGYR